MRRKQEGAFSTGPGETEHWQDLLTALAASLGPVRPGIRKLKEWELVLTARNVPHLFRRSPFKSRIFVPVEEAERAAAEISAYETENRGNPLRGRPVQSYPYDNRRDTALALGLLLLFFSLSSGSLPFFGMEHLPWYSLGKIDSAKILSGQWWRCFTALTLHADPAHVLSNVIVGGIFTGILCMRIGGGLGWLLFILGGGLGNFINALAHGPGHFAVGASTAVFAVVGGLTTLQIMQQRRVDASAIVPAACGLAFLAFLGAGGDRTDLGAHAFGFLAGAMLSIPVGLLIKKRRVFSPLINRSLAAASFVVLCAAWLFAFSQGS